MTIADWLIIVAVLIGPLIAIQLSRFLDNRKEVRTRKLEIFKTLMATRSYTASWDHVVALNRIDLEFNGNNPKERAVIEAWKAYLDLLRDGGMDAEQWMFRRVDLLVGLLHSMAHVLDYNFDKTHIKNSSYAPAVHGDIEDQLRIIREKLIELLNGKIIIPMEVVNMPYEPETTSKPEPSTHTPIESDEKTNKN